MTQDLIWETPCTVTIPRNCDRAAFRSAADADPGALAWLAHEAFTGTVDEAPEDTWLRKISNILDGRYGRFLTFASFIAQSAGDQLDGVVLVTDYAAYHAPTIALIAVASRAQRQGLGTCLLQQSIHALALNGAHVCRAHISGGNHASQYLFRRAGFNPLAALPE